MISDTKNAEHQHINLFIENTFIVNGNTGSDGIIQQPTFAEANIPKRYDSTSSLGVKPTVSHQAAETVRATNVRWLMLPNSSRIREEELLTNR